MNIVIFGLNHRTAGVELREKISFSANAIPEALKELCSKPGISEAVILSTCNRVEIYTVSVDPEKAKENIYTFIEQFHKIERSELNGSGYFLEGRDAIKHIIKVASGLDSMVVGEPQIFGQVKESFQKAHINGTAGKIFINMFPRIYNIVKRVRTDTDIGRLPASVSSVSVELAEKIFGDLKDRKVLILGAGKMSEITAKHLFRRNAASILVANRTYEKAEEMAKMFNGTAVKYSELSLHFENADIVIVSTGAPHYTVRREEVEKIMPARKYRQLFFIDISVPRNVEPSINEVENVYLYNIDDLQAVVEKNKGDRQKYISCAEEIIEAMLKDLYVLMEKRADIFGGMQREVKEVNK